MIYNFYIKVFKIFFLKYIKKWIPELKDVPAKAIHTWYKEWENYKDVDYGKPILDYEEQREKCLKMYKDALK